MASKRVALKWRKYKGEWRAGPFRVCNTLAQSYPFEVRLWLSAFGARVFIQCAKTLAEAKRVCEKLAARILGAMKP